MKLTATFKDVFEALKTQDRVQVTGFGTFKATDHAARPGRNPATGETIEIPAGRRVTFSSSQKLKEHINA